jgi:hypothetical protein
MTLAARIVVAVLAVLLFAGGQAFADRRVALVIGNSSYAPAPALDNPVNDATGVSVMLEGAGFQVVETRSNLDLAGMGRLIAAAGASPSPGTAGNFGNETWRAYKRAMWVDTAEAQDGVSRRTREYLIPSRAMMPLERG